MKEYNFNCYLICQNYTELWTIDMIVVASRSIEILFVSLNVSWIINISHKSDITNDAKIMCI